MKVLLFNGSTRNNGCTYLALDQVAQTLRQAGIETELLQCILPTPQARCWR